MSSMNHLPTNGFNVSLARTPNVTFRAQRVNIPSLDATPPVQPTPFKQLFTTPDTITMGPFTISFILDESMSAYFEIRDWIEAITFPDNFEQFDGIQASELGLKSDLTVHVLNSKGRPHMQMDISDAFPTNISEISLSISDTMTTIAVMDVTFAYNKFRVSKTK